MVWTFYKRTTNSVADTDNSHTKPITCYCMSVEGKMAITGKLFTITAVLYYKDYSLIQIIFPIITKRYTPVHVSCVQITKDYSKLHLRKRSNCSFIKR